VSFQKAPVRFPGKGQGFLGIVKQVHVL
jgi:hypothetical protein